MKDASKAIGVLPNDPGELKSLLRVKEQRIAVLEEQLQQLRHKRFGVNSEKVAADQLNLFNEAEAAADAPPGTVSETTIPEHKRRKRGRKAVDESLSRVIIEHDLPEADKICLCGCKKIRIVEETSEQLGFIIWTAPPTRFRRRSRCCATGRRSRPTEMFVTNMPAGLAKVLKMMIQRL